MALTCPAAEDAWDTYHTACEDHAQASYDQAMAADIVAAAARAALSAADDAWPATHEAARTT